MLQQGRRAVNRDGDLGEGGAVTTAPGRQNSITGQQVTVGGDGGKPCQGGQGGLLERERHLAETRIKRHRHRARGEERMIQTNISKHNSLMGHLPALRN